MGQLVTVREKFSSNPEVVRFEINRSLTGMGHERYGSPADIVRNRPVDEIARRLFEHGGVDGIHVNSSVITVHLAGGSRGEGMLEVIANLFKFYDADDSDNGTVEDESTATDGQSDEGPADDGTASGDETAATEETAPESVAGAPVAADAEEPAAGTDSDQTE